MTAIVNRLESIASGFGRAFCVSGTDSYLGCGAGILLCVINAVAHLAVYTVIYVLFHCYIPPFPQTVSPKNKKFIHKKAVKSQCPCLL